MTGTEKIPSCNRKISSDLDRPSPRFLDQAGWHTTRKLKVPKNLTLMSLPPACPELNAAENIWQYLRQTYLSNRRGRVPFFAHW